MRSSRASWIAFGLSMVAVFAVAVALQSWAEVLNRRFDLTTTHALSLSPYARSVLDGVREPLSIEVFYRRGERQESRELLDLLRSANPMVHVTLTDLDRSPGRARDLGITHYEQSLLTYQDRRVVVRGNDEETLVGAIARVLEEKPRVVYFTTGHGERGIAPGSEQDFARLAGALRTEGWTVRSLHLPREGRVPEDATVVVLAGPETDLLESELAALATWIDAGGAVLVLVDPVELPGLERWLAARGLLLRDDVVIDRQNRVFGSDGTNVLVPFYRSHPAVAALKLESVLGRGRSVSVAASGDDDPATGAAIVARTARESFSAEGAKRTRAGEVTMQPGQDRPGPIGVVGVNDRRGKLAVIGDADVASDAFLPLLGNKDFLLHVLSWLASRAETGARPKTEAASLGPLSPVYVSEQMARVILGLTVIALPGLVLAAGVVVVARRRRRT